jgi:hypothetical protein
VFRAGIVRAAWAWIILLFIGVTCIIGVHCTCPGIIQMLGHYGWRRGYPNRYRLALIVLEDTHHRRLLVLSEEITLWD